MKKTWVKLIDPQGFHARPIGIAMNKLREYECKGYIFHNGRQEDMENIFKVLDMKIAKGSIFMIAVEGQDENTASYALLDTLQKIGLIELLNN